MDAKLNSLIEELNGVDLVLEKLESKNNVSVFEKLCANCNRIFESFCEFDIIMLVDQGLGKKSIEFLARLKSQVVRLKEYKEAVTEFIKMSDESLNTPSVEAIQEQADAISYEASKSLKLENISSSPSIGVPQEQNNVVAVDAFKNLKLENTEGNVA